MNETMLDTIRVTSELDARGYSRAQLSTYWTRDLPGILALVRSNATPRARLAGMSTADLLGSIGLTAVVQGFPQAETVVAALTGLGTLEPILKHLPPTADNQEAFEALARASGVPGVDAVLADIALQVNGAGDDAALRPLAGSDAALLVVFGALIYTGCPSNALMLFLPSLVRSALEGLRDVTPAGVRQAIPASELN